VNTQKMIALNGVIFEMLVEISNKTRKKPEKMIEEIILREYHKR